MCLEFLNTNDLFIRIKPLVCMPTRQITRNYYKNEVDKYRFVHIT